MIETIHETIFLRIANVADTHIKHGRAFCDERKSELKFIDSIESERLMEDNGRATDEID